MSRIYYISATLVFLFVVCFYKATSPFAFPVGSIITVPEGVGLDALAYRLREKEVIRSPFWFRVTAIVLGGEHSMKAGQYFMSRPQNAFVVAWRIVRGDYDVETVKLTIPEGFNTAKIASLFDDRFQFFDREDFVVLAPEGYLFPDTYFLSITASATSTIKILLDNFTRKISSSMSDIESSGKTLEEIITMASIVENEAKTRKDREIIAGILWKRIKLGVPLQVDASFMYVNGKTTKELTADDLKINSPFNTYLYRGLPPTPISNPGLESILAALKPRATPFLYFLTGDDGTMHYSRTFDEHTAKKFKYINRR